jgi:hypothetical protein
MLDQKFRMSNFRIFRPTLRDARWRAKVRRVQGRGDAGKGCRNRQFLAEPGRRPHTAKVLDKQRRARQERSRAGQCERFFCLVVRRRPGDRLRLEIAPRRWGWGKGRIWTAAPRKLWAGQRALRFLISSRVRGARPRPGSQKRGKRPRKIFLPNFPCNPLKRLDSDERIQGNPSFSNPRFDRIWSSGRGFQGKPNPTRRRTEGQERANRGAPSRAGTAGPVTKSGD